MKMTAKRAAKFGLMAGFATLTEIARTRLHERREKRLIQLRRDRAYADALRRSAEQAKLPADTTRASTAAGSAQRDTPSPGLNLHPKAWLQVAIAAGKDWLARRAPSKGAALALYTLFSLAPMLVLVVAVAGLFFGADAVREALLTQIGGLAGTAGSSAFETILQGSRKENSGLIAGLISAALVLISATTAFGEMKNSLDELWEVPPNKASGVWGMLRERVLSLGLILVLALMLMMSLSVSTALSALQNLWGGLGSDSFEFVVHFLSNAVSFLIVTGLFAVIFKYLPATHIAWKDVLVGAVLTAVLFIAGKALIGLYIAKGDLSSTYGAAGSVVALITWIYYSAQIFFYGSLFTHEYAHQLGSRRGSPAPKRQPES